MNKVAHDHIGVLSYGVFNTSISRAKGIPSSYRFQQVRALALLRGCLFFRLSLSDCVGCSLVSSANFASI